MSGTKRGLPRNRLLVGDVRQVLDGIASNSVDTVITSPPYFRLRNYQHGNQIGLERHVDEWVDELLLVARGLKRVLKPTGSLWLNLGDTFSRHSLDGAAPKSLVLAPERLALAMVKDGWILRNKVIWSKPNPMPTSVKDRLSCTWEVVYFFTKSEHYFFDLDMIRVPHRSSSLVSSGTNTARPARGPRIAWSVPEGWRGPSSGSNSGLDRMKAAGQPGHPLGKNPGDVWSVPTAGYRGAHHAVFPARLIQKPLLATCPERVCGNCGTPWTRAPFTRHGDLAAVGDVQQRCDCKKTTTVPGIVLDPFMGSGTTAIAAEAAERGWIAIELNPDFADLALERIISARSLKTDNPPSLAAA